MFDHPGRPAPGLRCPVLKCIWQDDRAYHDSGALSALDEHMVEAHPGTEWSRRVVARREADKLRIDTPE